MKKIEFSSTIIDDFVRHVYSLSSLGLMLMHLGGLSFSFPWCYVFFVVTLNGAFRVGEYFKTNIPLNKFSAQFLKLTILYH